MKQGFFPGVLPIAAALSFLVVLGSAEAQVTILEVGPHGDFSTIQEAIDAAVVGAQTEIRVEGGTTYVENLLIPASFNDGELALLGGWDMNFTDRPFAPPDTIIDGNQADRALDVRMGGGSLVVDRFTLTNGLADMGAGVSVVLSGDALVTLEDVRITGNTVTATGSAMGGGMRAAFGDNGRVEVLNSRIHNNVAVNTAGGNARGGGLDILLTDSASFLVQGCEIDNNTIESAGGFLWGAGISIILVLTTSGDLLDTTIAENTAIGTNGYASGGVISLQNFGTLNVERTAFGLNAVTGGGTASQQGAAPGNDPVP